MPLDPRTEVLKRWGRDEARKPVRSLRGRNEAGHATSRNRKSIFGFSIFFSFLLFRFFFVLTLREVSRSYFLFQRPTTLYFLLSQSRARTGLSFLGLENSWALAMELGVYSGLLFLTRVIYELKKVLEHLMEVTVRSSHFGLRKQALLSQS